MSSLCDQTMDLVQFRERIYGKQGAQLFVLEPAWDSFRPIERVAWNGTQFSILDSIYTRDLFSPVYGFGSPEMKQKCRYLLEETELEGAREITDPVTFWKWAGESGVTWWKDRPCVFSSSCVSRDTQSWKMYLSYLNSRAKTLKNKLRRRMTKRLVPS